MKKKWKSKTKYRLNMEPVLKAFNEAVYKGEGFGLSTKKVLKNGN